MTISGSASLRMSSATARSWCCFLPGRWSSVCFIARGAWDGRTRCRGSVGTGSDGRRAGSGALFAGRDVLVHLGERQITLERRERDHRALALEHGQEPLPPLDPPVVLEHRLVLRRQAILRERGDAPVMRKLRPPVIS